MCKVVKETVIKREKMVIDGRDRTEEMMLNLFFYVFCFLMSNQKIY